MKRLIERFGYRRMQQVMIGTSLVATIALIVCIVMAVRTYDLLNSWVSFTLD